LVEKRKQPMAKIVSTHSFRGGTGKSNLTANVAAMLALQGARVCVVDTDVQSPGIHVPLGVDQEHLTFTLNHYLWGQCSIEDAATDVTGALDERGAALADGTALFLIPASIRTDDIARILKEGYDPACLDDGLHLALHRLRLDYLLIDTHPGVNEETLLSIAISDVLILLLRPDYQDYQGTAVTVELARHLDVPELRLVMNKVPSSVDWASLREDVERQYQAPVAGMLPLSLEMVELGSGGLFCLKFPEHPYTQEISRIAASLA
jgi:MinD-like ATPase involved in chromosome partitioning or flagellar assembly